MRYFARLMLLDQGEVVGDFHRYDPEVLELFQINTRNGCQSMKCGNIAFRDGKLFAFRDDQDQEFIGSLTEVCSQMGEAIFADKNRTSVMAGLRAGSLATLLWFRERGLIPIPISLIDQEIPDSIPL